MSKPLDYAGSRFVKYKMNFRALSVTFAVGIFSYVLLFVHLSCRKDTHKFDSSVGYVTADYISPLW